MHSEELEFDTRKHTAENLFCVTMHMQVNAREIKHKLFQTVYTLRKQL